MPNKKITTKTVMPKNGLRIRNYQAGSIYGYDLGIRKEYDYNRAMLSNSLFSRFMCENGMNVYAEKSTRDIICINFDYGTRSYEDEIKYYKKKIEDAKKDKNLTLEEVDKKVKHFEKIIEVAKSQKDCYKEASAWQIREIFYQEGVEIHYPQYKVVNGERIVANDEVIKYKMLYRSPGKAKNGSCMFINEKLYDVANQYLCMGITLPYNNAPIVEKGAYCSLVTSSIEGTIKIDPKSILVISDIDSFVKKDVVSVELNENDECIAVKKNDYTLKNTIFDGQALIDSSIFPNWGNGYVLLRQHFCKMAAFKSNIQLFFRDYFGENYDTATVKDMFGNEVLAKNIKLITTENAMKWMKFDISFDYWCDRVNEGDCQFGVVKTAHESKLGKYQRMSYQMVNALDDNIMAEVLSSTVEYIERLKNDNEFFLEHLNRNKNFTSDFEALYALCRHNPDFANCDYFRNRKTSIIYNYLLDVKNGHILQNADNLVIVGSPYAMLLHSVGEDVEKDDTFSIEDGCIQCFTERFGNGEYLAEFRSPFNSKNNMGYLHNIYDDRFFRYFDFGKQIIAVNMIHTDFQDRNNGADMDSDSLYTTNQKNIVECARYCYLHYPTIVNNIPKAKNEYTNELINYARIDNKLAAAQLAIGESSNLAQICLSYTYNFDDEKYQDYVCILSVLAQIAIDNAKRAFKADVPSEIKRIKKDIDIRNKHHGYPQFWTATHRDFNEQKINKHLKCPMNSVYELKIGKRCESEKMIPMSDFFINHPIDQNRRKSMKVEKMIEDFSLDIFKTRIGQANEEELWCKDYFILREDFDDLVEAIKRTYLSKGYLGLFSWLLNRAFMITPNIRGQKNKIESLTHKNRTILMSVLYNVNPDAFLSCFEKNKYFAQ